MAVQKFLQGGYVGKLGATVGQRWKNVRTVRAYVIPHNPRTELQQANRKRFATAIRYAQEALIYNKGAPCWKSDTRTEFQNRTSNAKMRIDGGIEGLSAIPLVPTGTTPFRTLADIVIEINEAGLYVIKSELASRLSESREMTVSINVKETATGSEVINYYKVVTEPSNNVLFEIDPSSGFIPFEGSSILGVSCDDVTHDGNIVYIPPQEIRPPQEIVLDDVTVSFDGSDYVVIESAKASTLSGTYSIEWDVRMFDAVSETSKDVVETATTRLGLAELARIKVSPTYTLYGDCLVQALAVVKVTGASILVIPNFTVNKGQKEIALSLDSENAVLSASDRRMATMQIDFGFMLPSPVVKKSFSTEYVALVNGSLQKVDSLPCTYQIDALQKFNISFSDIEKGVSVNQTNKITGEVVMQTNALKCTASINATFKDSTQKSLTGVTAYYKKNSYSVRYNINCTCVDDISSYNFIVIAKGLNFATGQEEVSSQQNLYFGLSGEIWSANAYDLTSTPVAEGYVHVVSENPLLSAIVYTGTGYNAVGKMEASNEQLTNPLSDMIGASECTLQYVSGQKVYSGVFSLPVPLEGAVADLGISGLLIYDDGTSESKDEGDYFTYITAFDFNQSESKISFTVTLPKALSPSMRGEMFSVLIRVSNNASIAPVYLIVNIE